MRIDGTFAGFVLARRVPSVLALSSASSHLHNKMGFVPSVPVFDFYLSWMSPFSPVSPFSEAVN